MSLWIRRRDKQGRVHWCLVGVPWLWLIAIIGVLLALLLPLVQWLRSLF
jgi:hypothetical protein